MSNKKEVCDKCEKKFNTKGMKKKNGKLYCHHCFLKLSKCLMPILNGGIPKSYLPPKLKERKKKEVTPPKMKGEKKIVVSKQLHLYLTKDEKNVLYKKFIVNMSNQDASDRVEFISEKMKELAKKIRVEAKEKKLTEEQMQSKFIEGLAKYSADEE